MATILVKSRLAAFECKKL